ncbi:glycoside hydrolase family 47 protein [Streptacidiphilus albus]|uniref:glycoside hydrolase family 47 protein n=1 Tax=Streptacidiphilus albus TaxID=105425 RepID=UPI00054BC37D|nr:glycoside hydrolase family 47 protein [Streptacidiphilus albus]
MGPNSTFTRRSLLTATAGAALVPAVAGRATAVPRPVAVPRAAAAPLPDGARIAAEVRTEFLHGWRGYTAAAWGYDEVCPVSGRHHDFFAPGRTFGLSIVEALDTLYLMGLDTDLAESCDWIEAHLDPAQDAEVEVFEAVIRLVGGLVAGYHATGRGSLLARAREFADRLLPAFTRSPTGIPYTTVNLRTGAVQGTTVALAQAGTSVMEFGELSRLTGDDRYLDASMRAYTAVLDRRSSLDLLGTSLNAETGRWVDPASVAPNPPVDSFYEYLWGGGALLKNRQLTDWFQLLTRPVLARQSVRADGLLWFRSVDHRTGRPVGPPRQSELAAFYAGLLGKGGFLQTGADYYRSWTAALDRHPVLPETLDYTDLAAVDRGNQLRPEYPNSAFDLWRITGDGYYRQTAYRWFRSMAESQRVAGGYTVCGDVTVRGMQPGDLTPAYWFAENLKYLWLMFSGTPRFDYRRGLLSTEGKVLRGLLPG